MSVKTVICDDISDSIFVIKSYISKLNIPDINLIGCATSGEELIDLCKKESPDLVLLDIEMPSQNGVELAKKILEFLPNALFIFITAYPSYSLNAFEVHAVDYILKPFSMDRLGKSLRYVINKFSKREHLDSDNYITFACDNNLYSIRQNDLLFAERIGRKTLIHTRTGTLNVYDSIKNLQSKLNKDLFIRTHNSYLVNKSAINKVESNWGSSKVIIKDYDKFAFVSRRNKSLLDKFFLE